MTDLKTHAELIPSTSLWMALDHMRGNVVSVVSCSLRSTLSCCAVECIFLS